MKKNFSAILLAVIIFAGSQNFANARAIWVGVYPETNLNAYLLTETVNLLGVNPFGPMFTCTIRAGNNYYINYKFTVEGSGRFERRVVWSNSDGYSGYLVDGNCPVESATYQYVTNNWNWHS